MKQDAPFAVQIELVEGCSLACDFCGVNGIREKPGNFKFMSLATVFHIAELLKIAKADGWNPRIEFAMHGEPSLHPSLCDAIEILRTALGPKTSMVMFSNGTGFLKEGLIDDVLEAGINTIGFDNYEHVNIVPRVMANYRLKEGKAPVYYYPQQKEHNLHNGRRVGHRDIVVIQDISKADDGNHSTLNTHCGGGMKPTSVLHARCAKPFRELAIRWDGNVALCCNDFRGVYKVQNVNDALSLQELWGHPRFVAARKMLMLKNRNFAPCEGCNAKSMRVGLLPDKLGKTTMDPLTAEDSALLLEAVAGPSFTEPVLREWEFQGDARYLPQTVLVYRRNILDEKGRK